MRDQLIAVLLLLAGTGQTGPQGPAPNAIWQKQYQERSAASMAEQFESPSRPVFRYRAAILGMLELESGMVAAEIGAGSGFLARMMAAAVAPAGRAVATELDPKMVAYMNERARTEGIANFTAVQGQPASTGLDPASIDAMAIVNTFSFFDRPTEMMQSIAGALKPGGLLVIVDFPREGIGGSATGIDAETVVSMVTAAGFERVDEISVVPGQYSLRFKKRRLHPHAE